MRKKIAISFAFLGMFFGCNYDNVADLPQVCDATSEVSFTDDIVPLMGGSCSSASVACHSSNSTSGIPLDTYEGVKEQADNGKLYSSVIWDGNASPMPKLSSNKIDTCSIGKIKRWVDAGAPNN